MKTVLLNTTLLLLIITPLIGSTSCKKNKDLTSEEREALLYMWEEEKMARDTYIYFDNLWGTEQFGNIKNSEQNHMESIQTLLEKYDIPYNELPEGEFSDPDLQAMYNSFISTGAESEVAALRIGATIEDLDIYDLKQNINDFEQEDIDEILEKLLCASGNHMRAFTKGLEDNGSSYTPKYISESDYQEILDAPHTNCN